MYGAVSRISVDALTGVSVGQASVGGGTCPVTALPNLLIPESLLMYGAESGISVNARIKHPCRAGERGGVDVPRHGAANH